jgi:glutathione S-transferase
MALTFYYGSGSSFGWKVWLSLEHKQVAYDLKLLSFSEGDLKKPEFRQINPRGKVPTIVDDGFALWESSAIVEYLEDRYPQNPLLPGGPNTRALARRIANEADNYLYKETRKLFGEVFFSKQPDLQKVDQALPAIREELYRFDTYLAGDFFVGPLSVADFTVFPIVRTLMRVQERFPNIAVSEFFSARLRAWIKRIEELPYYGKTFPPHWKT